MSSLDDRKDYEEGANTEHPANATTDRTGTARRAEQATGRAGAESTRADAERAFEASRGDRERRPEPDGSEPED